jgi:hypothetical protein
MLRKKIKNQMYSQTQRPLQQLVWGTHMVEQARIFIRSQHWRRINQNNRHGKSMSYFV